MSNSRRLALTRDLALADTSTCPARHWREPKLETSLAETDTSLEAQAMAPFELPDRNGVEELVGDDDRWSFRHARQIIMPGRRTF